MNCTLKRKHGVLILFCLNSFFLWLNSSTFWQNSKNITSVCLCNKIYWCYSLPTFISKTCLFIFLAFINTKNCYFALSSFFCVKRKNNTAKKVAGFRAKTNKSFLKCRCRDGQVRLFHFVLTTFVNYPFRFSII